MLTFMCIMGYLILARDNISGILGWALGGELQVGGGRVKAEGPQP
jgi:hypothetical protein